MSYLMIAESLNSIVSEDQLPDLYAVFQSIRDYEIPIVRHTIYPGSSLIRQRINPSGKNYSCVSDLSYPPQNMTPMGRANLPGYPMFYACSFNAGAPIPRLIADFGDDHPGISAITTYLS